MVRSGAVLTLAVHIGESASIPYEGPLIIAAVDANLTGLASTTEAPQGVGTLKVELSRDQISTPVKTVLFVAGNAVSIFNKSVPITLAGKLVSVSGYFQRWYRILALRFHFNFTKI